MSIKAIVHLGVLLVISIFLWWIWDTSERVGERAAIVYKMFAFIVGGLYFGSMTVIYVLPAVMGKITEEALGSSEESEPDPFAKAHSKLANGDYEEAIEAFREAAEKDPLNRMPWIEISKVWLSKFEDPDAALATLQNALESQEWPESDAAALMFRIEEIFLNEKNDRESAITTLNQIVETFPETRYSANATHKLRELGAL